MDRATRIPAAARARAVARSLAVAVGGLPHSVGTVDSPPPHVARDITNLWLRSARSHEAITDSTSSEIVTMTTHGERLRDVWLAIESIGRGTVKPHRLVLWLDRPLRRIPWRLRRLQQRGLEIRFVSPGLGVHTKYWPLLSSEPLDRPLVMSDDDIIYPQTWLEELRGAHQDSPGCVIAHRAHVIGMSSESAFTPYSSWRPCESDAAHFAHFATSVSGQLLPPQLQKAIRDDGEGFLRTAPTADDVWLHYEAVKHGFATRQVLDRQQHWWFIPGSQQTGLNAVNVTGGENDRQLAATHSAETRRRIWGELATIR
ncbi:hypothetical protein JNB62_13060 [Microbacterium jejuense]|uniref:Glycosyl transferase family 2 n=1 Tax=Microbacterium jejuense TaxID=1263637 RepID=A0ABS7HQ99_9MICO|nr:hypothetical protein [Microbacterium jejuense]MBW9094619.1 hypothetical protein [Microbacterium jejuense]